MYMADHVQDTVIQAQTAAAEKRRAGGASRWRALELGLLICAAGLLIGSMFLPYWGITLFAPQYPKGLHVLAYVDRLTGDVREVDGLNHYIGMMKLDDAAQLERSISRIAIPIIAVLAVASFWVKGRWKWLLIVPIVIYPIVFVGDLFGWLYYAGHSLDPHAALSSSIKPFTPRIIGTGTIGQFRTHAEFQSGFFLSVLAAVLAVIAPMLRRAANNGSRG